MTAALFPEPFVRGIQRLRIVARHRITGDHRGEHASQRAGAGMDFRDYRAYSPGDDLRRVDWNVYRRTRRLMLRLYDEPQRLGVYVLLDVSASMDLESPPRVHAAKQVAAAMAAAAAHQHDPVLVVPFSNELHPPLQLRMAASLPRLLAELEALGTGGPTDLGAVVRGFARARRRPDLLILVSDFFDPGGIDPVLHHLASVRHRLILAQLTRRSDRAPALEGDLRLIDCEDGSALRVSISPRMRRHYDAAYAGFCAKLQRFAVRRGAPLVRIDTDVPVLPQLDSVFHGGVLRL